MYFARQTPFLKPRGAAGIDNSGGGERPGHRPERRPPAECAVETPVSRSRVSSRKGAREGGSATGLVLMQWTGSPAVHQKGPRSRGGMVRLTGADPRVIIPLIRNSGRLLA